MASPPRRPDVVRNTLFPHIAGTQPHITITGNEGAILELSNAIHRGFVADIPQNTVYHATGHYITRYLAGAGEPAPTVQNLQLVYYGAGFRTTASQFFGLAPGHPFFAAHQNRQLAGHLENNHFMIPYLFQAWFIQRARRMGSSPVTRVGVVVRNVGTDGAEDTYTVSMYNNSSTNPVDSLVWFVYDPSVVNPWATLTKPQPAPPKLPAAGPSVPAAGPSAPNTPIFAAGPRRRPPPITGPVRQGATLRVTAATLANNAAPSAPVTPVVPNAAATPAIPNIPAAPVAPTAPVNTKNTKIVPRKIAPTPAKNEKQRKIDNAPDWNTALPWDLLADCTLEELVIYYPNHVFNHPGLALLFVHYSHRIAGKNRSFTESAERILVARGKKKEKDDKKKKKKDNKEKKDDKLSSMLRQWVLMAVGEILKHYNAAEADHLTGVYALLNDRGVNNVMELFQMEFMRVPARFRTSMQPAVPLHEVGAYITGAHPTGNFANRVQRAMHYHRMGINEPAVSPPRPSSTHPMIALLRDYTANVAQRFQEETFLYNQTAPIDGLIRPQQMFPDEIFQRVENDPSGLIWQMTRQHERVIDVLNHNLNRRHVLEHYWSDLKRDTWLWIDLGMAPEEWKALLPRGALLHHGCLDEDGNVVKEKLDGFQAAQRKTAEMSHVARVKGVKDSKWNKKLLMTHPGNKALYDPEKNKWDEWSKQQSDYRGKGAGNAGKRTVEEMDDESEEESGRTKKRVKVRKTGAAAATQTPTAPQPPLAPTFQQPLPTLQEQTLGGSWFAPYDQYGLYNVDPSGHFMNVPFLPGEFAGNGTMPQWWRDARRLLFRLRGVTPPASMDQSFDQAIDVVPNPNPTPGAPALHFQADFRAPPTPSPPRFSPQQPIGDLPSASMDQDNTMLFGGAPGFGAFHPSTITPSLLNNGVGSMMEGLVVPDPTFGDEAAHMNFALSSTLNSSMVADTPATTFPYFNQPIGDVEPLFSNAELGQFIDNAQTGWTPPEGASPDSQPGLTDAMFAGAHTQEQSQPLRRSPRRRSNGSSSAGSAGSAGTSGSEGKRRSPRNHPGSDW